MTKFLICTMYCGEPDFPHLVASLEEQGVEYEHRVFENMPEMEAHNAVYQAFNEADPEMIRAKIDADIVLNSGALQKVATKIGASTWLDPQAHDFFTDGALHAGMAFYGARVKFREQTNPLKCDRNVARGASHTTMGVIARHAHYADEWTGFHYGFHRGLKSQLPVYDRLVRAHKIHGDRVRLMAIRGFELAQSDRYKAYHLGHEPVPTHHNYGDELRKLFDEFNVDDPPKLERTWR